MRGAGGVGAVRLGMGPIGMTGAGAAGMGGMVAAGGAAGMGAAGMSLGKGMWQGIGMMGGVGRARPRMKQGPGPTKFTNHGLHWFPVCAMMLFMGHHTFVFYHILAVYCTVTLCFSLLLLLLSDYLRRVS